MRADIPSTEDATVVDYDLFQMKPGKFSSADATALRNDILNSVAQLVLDYSWTYETFCLSDAELGNFADGIGSVQGYVTFEFTACIYDETIGADENITCRTEDEMRTWHEENLIQIDFYESRTKVDFSSPTDYLSRQMEWYFTDWISPNQYTTR